MGNVVVDNVYSHMRMHYSIRNSTINVIILLTNIFTLKAYNREDLCVTLSFVQMYLIIGKGNYYKFTEQ